MMDEITDLPSRRDVECELALRDLRWMVRKTWRWTETHPYVHGTVVDAISEHLMAVARGKIKRLIITVPPRHTKSLLTSVFFPAWVWLDRPELQFLFASYAHNLSVRDSVRCRRIMASPDYQDILQYRWGDKKAWKFTGDQNTKIRFDNDRNGYRIATSVEGQLTGEGGDIIVVDDAHNVIEGESEAVRKGTLQWWDEAMSSRLNDAKTGSYVVIGQRVHEEDLIGHILDTDKQGLWSHLNLPARYEGDGGVRSRTPLERWKDDWREVEGEPLWPERFGEQELQALEEALGPYAASAQLQQRPSPRTGGMFQPERTETVDNRPTSIDMSCRYWDKAGTADGGAYTAGVRMDKLTDGRYMVSDVVRGQWVASKRERIIRETAETDGRTVTVMMEQEPGSGGKESLENSIRNLAGFKVYGDRVTGSKEARAEGYSIQFNIGNVLILNASWRKEFLEEHRHFPMGRYKDQVDAAAGCFNFLSRIRKRAGAW